MSSLVTVPNDLPLPPAYRQENLVEPTTKAQNKQKEVLHLCRWSTHTHGGFYAEKPLHRGFFCTQKVLHKETFILRSFAHKRLGVFTHRSCYLEKSLHRELQYTEAFTHRIFSDRETFEQRIFTHGSFYTQRNLYTNALLHRETFTHRRKHLHKEIFIQNSCYIRIFLDLFFFHRKSLHRGALIRSNKLKLAAIRSEKHFAGCFGNSLAPQKILYS